MPRILIITSHFPPRPTIGSVRIGRLAKYLSKFGWEPIVLAPELPAGARPPVQLAETGYREVLNELTASWA
jgi:hypothetical protein